MSPVPSFSAAPQRPPAEPRPEPASPPSEAPGNPKKWLVLLAFVGICCAAAAYLWHSREAARPAPLAQLPTARAVRGVLQNSLRLAGSIAATHYADIAAPILQAPDNGRGLVLIFLPGTGTFVHKGEIVARIDGQAVQDHLDDVRATVSQGELDLLRLRANQAANFEAMQQRARAAKGNLEKAKQDIRAAPAKTEIDRELLRLALDEAQEAYDEYTRQITTTDESQVAGLHVAQFAQDYNVRHVKRHERDFDRLTIRSPMDGTIIMRSIWRNGEQSQVRLGDQLAPGQPFMRVFDRSTMRLETSMNQAESELVHIGQHAKIHFDAYPEIQLDGTVTAVGSIAQGGRRMNYYIRQVPVRISIEGHDPRVLPDLSASADVVLAEQDDSIIVPRQAVMEEDGKPVVYVKQAGTFTAREVEVGLTSNTEAAVKGLQAGDEVALGRPF